MLSDKICYSEKCSLERALYLFYCSQNVILCVLFIPGKKDNCILRSRLQMQTSSIRLSHWPRWSWPCRAQGGCRRWGSSCRSPRPTETSSWGPETNSCKQGTRKVRTLPGPRCSGHLHQWQGGRDPEHSIYDLATSYSATVVSIVVIVKTISITIITVSTQHHHHKSGYSIITIVTSSVGSLGHPFEALSKTFTTIITITISITIITIVINLMICHLLCGFPWTSLWSGAQQLHGRHRPDRLARIWTGRHFVKTFNSRKIN